MPSPQAPSEDYTSQNYLPTPPPLGMAGMLKPGEQILFIVRKHLIGIVAIYLQILAAVLAMLAIGYVAAPSFADSLSNDSYRFILAGVIIALALMVLILLIATYVYRLSVLIVTDQSLIQVIQSGLFGRKVSRFTMSDVEDVSADQNGIFATIFNYGTLTVQTAGTLDNFIFNYCPDPNTYASKILAASQTNQDSE